MRSSSHSQNYCRKRSTTDPKKPAYKSEDLQWFEEAVDLGGVQVEYWTKKPKLSRKPVSWSENRYTFGLKHCERTESQQSVSSGVALNVAPPNAWFVIHVSKKTLHPNLDQVNLPALTFIDPQSPIGLLLFNCVMGLFYRPHAMSEFERQAVSQSVSLLLATACNSKLSRSKFYGDPELNPLFVDVQRIISNSLQDSMLNVAYIAEKAGVSRSCLYRLFCKEGGVMQFVRHKRLEAARRDICDQTANGLQSRISTIAFRWGFSSPAQFSRAFSQHFGCSPRKARRNALGKLP